MWRYTLSLFIALNVGLFAYEDYSKMAQIYAQNQAAGTDYLAFRNIPELLKLYTSDKKNLMVLDYGCGAGLSTRFMKKILSEKACVIGVDISPEMLTQALLADPQGQYLLMEKKIPFESSIFDVVFCNFVLFEIPSKEEIIRIFSDVKRTMKKGGVIVATTATPEMYNCKNHWVTLDANFPENDNLKSGDIATVTAVFPGGDSMTFHDYYWLEEDYCFCFEKAGLKITSINYPLGLKDEILDWTWKDEISIAPYVIFVLQND